MTQQQQSAHASDELAYSCCLKFAEVKVVMSRGQSQCEQTPGWLAGVCMPQLTAVWDAVSAASGVHLPMLAGLYVVEVWAVM